MQYADLEFIIAKPQPHGTTPPYALSVPSPPPLASPIFSNLPMTHENPKPLTLAHRPLGLAATHSQFGTSMMDGVSLVVQRALERGVVYHCHCQMTRGVKPYYRAELSHAMRGKGRELWVGADIFFQGWDWSWVRGWNERGSSGGNSLSLSVCVKRTDLRDEAC